MDLQKLMELPGAIGAFRFSDRGELLDSTTTGESGLNQEVLDLLSHVCVANQSIATMQARGWEKMTGQSGFYPVEGFTLIGFDWSAVVNGQYGVVMANNGADYEAAYQALQG